tara:strand:+ start:1401 stop:1583 length:183 start_codon:yes stop_codon:yes gene_type:complete
VEGIKLSTIYETLFVPLKIELSLIVDALLGGQLTAPNFERDDGTLKKEIYVGETISVVNN